MIRIENDDVKNLIDMCEEINIVLDQEVDPDCNACLRIDHNINNIIKHYQDKYRK